MNLPIDLLRGVRTIVVHRKSPTEMCPDGMASAMILHDALPEAAILYIAYGTKEHTDLPATEGMLFCDFSPPVERVQEFVRAGAIVLDHHASARDIVAAFGDRGVFADEKTEPGVSGAVLAYLHVWRRLYRYHSDAHRSEVDQLVDRFATLAGIRDTWQTQHPDWLAACHQAEALKFYPPDYLLKLFTIEWHLPIGALLYEKNQEFARDLSRRGVIRSIDDNLDVIMFGTTSVENASEFVRDRADIIAGFRYTVEDNEPIFVVSLRNGRSDIDLGRIAKHFGGGGHTKAAAFSVKLFGVASASPYDLVPLLLRRAHILTTNIRKKWSVWSEGYHAQGGGPEPAHFWGSIEADSFRAACDLLLKDKPSYDSTRVDFWGCKLFDNERDARRSFG